MTQNLRAQGWLGGAWLGEEGNENSLQPHEAIRLMASVLQVPKIADRLRLGGQKAGTPCRQLQMNGFVLLEYVFNNS